MLRVMQLRKQIGVKLFIMMVTLFLLALAPVMFAVFSTVSYFGNYIVSINRAQIREQSHEYLRIIAREQARTCEAFFSRATLASAMMAAQAREVYNELAEYDNASPYYLQLEKNSDNGMYYTPSGQDVISVYWGGEEISPSVSRELLALSQLDPVQVRAKRGLPESLATHMITVSGIGRYLTDDLNARKAVFNLPPVGEFDLRDGEPLEMFTRVRQPGDKTRWTRPYKDDVVEGLMMTASTPVVDSEGVLRAITGVDVPLKSILTELSDWLGTGDAGGSKFFFIVDRDGRLIAFPTDYLETFGIKVDWSQFRFSDDVFDYRLEDSSNSDVTGLANSLVGGDAETFELQLGGDVFVLTQQYLPTLDWNLILVASESHLVSSVKRTEAAIHGIIRELGKKFLISALLILVFVFVAVFLAVYHFVSPLKRLSDSAIRVGEGDLSTRCNLARNDELGSLADSFNGMVEKLEMAERVQSRHAKQLEMEVEEQTRDLRRKNFELKDVIAELNVESERRKRAVDALEQNEEQIRTAMDASLAGLCIIQNQRFRYLNPQFTNIFGYEAGDIVDELDPIEIIAPEEQETIIRQWLAILSGEKENPQAVQCVRKDGSRFDALMGADLTLWRGKSALVSTVMDISEQKRTEEQLLVSRNMLQASLKEKDVLMREIYHRTKNNMLVIISMLNLQAMDIEDDQVRIMFRDTENRIRAMSLAHEKLYQSGNLSEVDLLTYLRDVVNTLVETMVYGDRIVVDLEGEEGISISLDAIVPLGLAVNEIVTNSIKHAFPQNRSGSVIVRLMQEEDGMVVVQVGDDGVGLPDGFEVVRSPSLGMQITVSLIEKQLQGKLDVDRSRGTMYTLRFKETSRPKRI